jgi:hypothetical protein
MDLFIITKNVLKNGQSRETGNIEYVRRRKTKQKHNARRYALDTTTQTNTNDVSKTWVLLQTTESKDGLDILWEENNFSWFVTIIFWRKDV